MSTKEEAKAKLKKAGYNVVDDNAVVTVLVPAKANIKNIVKDVKEILVKIDYKSSFGIRQTDASLELDNADEENEAISEVNDETKNEKLAEEDYFDEEDENPESAGSVANFDTFDMDVNLDEESVQFSLEDFGMM